MHPNSLIFFHTKLLDRPTTCVVVARERLRHYYQQEVQDDRRIRKPLSPPIRPNIVSIFAYVNVGLHDD